MPVKIASGKKKEKSLSNTPDRRKDLCPSPTCFQSKSANLGFLYWKSSKEEWASFYVPTPASRDRGTLAREVSKLVLVWS